MEMDHDARIAALEATVEGLIDRILRLEALTPAARAGEARREVISRWRAKVHRVFRNEWVTVRGLRELMNTDGMSNKAIGMALSEAGFERRQGSDAVRWYIGEPVEEGAVPPPAPAGRPGPKIELPSDLAEKVAEFIALRAKMRSKKNALGEPNQYDRTVGAFLGQWFPGRAFSRIAQDEVERLYPNTFASRAAGT